MFTLNTHINPNDVTSMTRVTSCSHVIAWQRGVVSPMTDLLCLILLIWRLVGIFGRLFFSYKFRSLKLKMTLNSCIKYISQARASNSPVTRRGLFRHGSKLSWVYGTNAHNTPPLKKNLRNDIKLLILWFMT